MLIAHFLNVVSQSGAMKMSTFVSGPLSAVKSSIENNGFQQLVATSSQYSRSFGAWRICLSCA